MPAGVLSGRQHKGLLGPRGLPENDGTVNWPPSVKSGCCRSRNFFGGGERDDKWRIGTFETNSTSHGLTRFTFCSKSGSSQVTCSLADR